MAFLLLSAQTVLSSQSPQIGSMFLTVSWECDIDTFVESQSPQIGSMFLTAKQSFISKARPSLSQSPQIGSMFLTRKNKELVFLVDTSGRNPLKSGQCFLQPPSFLTDYRKLNTPFSGTSLFLCFLFPYLTYLLQ